jgi:hypothetical protein
VLNVDLAMDNPDPAVSKVSAASVRQPRSVSGGVASPALRYPERSSEVECRRCGSYIVLCTSRASTTVDLLTKQPQCTFGSP